ncbi:Zinc metalloproteinase-disintegrin-like ohanin [Trichoplax sp. H2]|nr:Zinc metalloproteinase-disintegrin-like ohanin [Trichoplax sp. H2]|eukprot:RDD40651.1 Zinc metalloproteinase-disintegrin-like ohanin [Trichoplax sp. H2]
MASGNQKIFDHVGNRIILDLERNDHLASQQFRHSYQVPGANLIDEFRDDDSPHIPCYYHGQVRQNRQLHDYVAISACKGLEGTFQLDRQRYEIEPLDDLIHVVYKASINDEIKEEIFSSKLDSIPNGLMDRRKIALKNDMIPALNPLANIKLLSQAEKSQLEVLVISDLDVYKNQYRRKFGKIRPEVLSTMNRVALEYKPLNLVVIVDIPFDAIIVLSTTARFQANSPGSSVAGKSLFKICGFPYSIRAVEYIAFKRNPLEDAFIITHELGHSLNLTHQLSARECDHPPCIMASQYDPDEPYPTHFSKANQRNFIQYNIKSMISIHFLHEQCPQCFCLRYSYKSYEKPSKG